MHLRGYHLGAATTLETRENADATSAGVADRYHAVFNRDAYGGRSSSETGMAVLPFSVPYLQHRAARRRRDSKSPIRPIRSRRSDATPSDKPRSTLLRAPAFYIICILLITRRRIVMGTILMRRTYSLLFALSLTVLPVLHAERIDNRNFAIDTCFPNPNSIQLAEDRARAYWAKHVARFGAEPRYLAVETSKVFPSEVQDLWPKLINSETTGSFFSHGRRNSYSNLQLHGIMIFDTRTGHFVSNQGYISVDTPPRGGVARFASYIARYIGWG
jgi:hypothetical protein